MIDARLYLELPSPTGVGASGRPPAELAALLRGEMSAAGVDQALAVGPVARAREVADWLPGLFAVAPIDEAVRVEGVETDLRSGRVRALAVGLGDAPPGRPELRPYFELAERFRVPVLFPSAEDAPAAKLRHAHPLGVDDAAADFPRVNFVLPRFGAPWFAEAAAVIARRSNVWADLSGLISLRASAFGVAEQEEALRDRRAAVRGAFLAAERPNRFLFASGWPRAPIAAYRDFIHSLVPASCHPLVFEANARELFGL